MPTNNIWQQWYGRPAQWYAPDSPPPSPTMGDLPTPHNSCNCSICAERSTVYRDQLVDRAQRELAQWRERRDQIRQQEAIERLQHPLRETRDQEWEDAYQTEREAIIRRRLAEEEVRARRFAEVESRSRALLELVLTPDERDRYRQTSLIEILGSDGRTYRIGNGYNGNIRILRGGPGSAPVEQWCAHPRSTDRNGCGIPENDIHAGQVLAIRHDAPGFLRVANFYWRMPAPDYNPPVGSRLHEIEAARERERASWTPGQRH